MTPRAETKLVTSAARLGSSNAEGSECRDYKTSLRDGRPRNIGSRDVGQDSRALTTGAHPLV